MTSKQKKVIEILKEKLSQREKEIKTIPSYYEIYKAYNLEDKLLDLGAEQIGLAMYKAGYDSYTVVNLHNGTKSGYKWLDKIIELMEKMPM